ncbi:DUF3800 domain-containing protein [Sorangium sp. So ce281]|uniref:DUF3800 domain-containing protein n=1 Tax=unclassified Sorangium TaxID=2621164 RepID=UPI003F5FE16E
MTLGVHAFADEYGDTNLATEKSGVTDFFIITAILVDDHSVDALRSHVDEVRRSKFGNGEMKSSSIGSDDARRIKVLEAATALPYKSYSLAVDKRELDRESGLAYKRSFFKHLNKRLYERIYRIFDNVTTIADEHGTEAFMEGFKRYVDRELPPNLFSRRRFEFRSSHSEPFLQLADVISGSIARGVDPKKKSPNSKEILDLVAKRSIGIEFWPPMWVTEPEQILNDPSQSKHDKLVERHCLRQAKLFLQKIGGTSELSEALQAQAEILQFLLFNIQFVSDSDFVATGAIADRINSSIGLTVTHQQIRYYVACLRDADVIVASSPKGYKIPVSVADMASFVAHANTIIPPMLKRLARARSELRLASLGELDILRNEHFEILRQLLEAVDKDPA